VKHADKLLKHYQQEQKKQTDEQTQQLIDEEANQAGQEVDALEQMLNETKKDNDVSKTYMLFNYVCQQYPEQILRYVPPL